MYFLDGVLLDINSADPLKVSRTFTWEHSDANYICLSARAINYCELDNLIVRPLPLGQALSAQHALESGLWGSQTDASADPDNDGLTTAEEWLWGTNPALSDAPAAAAQLSVAPGSPALPQFTIGHRRVKHGELSGVIYPVRYSTNLSLARSTWPQTMPPVASTAAIPGSAQHEWVERAVPGAITDFVPFMALTVEAAADQ